MMAMRRISHRGTSINPNNNIVKYPQKLLRTTRSRLGLLDQVDGFTPSLSRGDGRAAGGSDRCSFLVPVGLLVALGTPVYSLWSIDSFF